MNKFTMMPILQRILGLLLLLVLFPSAACQAEQIVIDENSEDRVVAGDFFCSPCYAPMLSDAEAVDIASKTLTTGDLYRYFQSRGITKLNRMSLQVDVDCDPANNQSVCLSDLTFQIQDSSNNLVTHAGLGGLDLLLDKSEITSFKPEAVLEFELGYDFMQRFSSNSTESVVLNFQAPEGSTGLQPRIVVSQELSSFSTWNFLKLCAFVAFWSVVFYGVHLMTRPGQSVGREAHVNSFANRRATAAPQ